MRNLIRLQIGFLSRKIFNLLAYTLIGTYPENLYRSKLSHKHNKGHAVIQLFRQLWHIPRAPRSDSNVRELSMSNGPPPAFTSICHSSPGSIFISQFAAPTVRVLRIVKTFRARSEKLACKFRPVCHSPSNGVGELPLLPEVGLGSKKSNFSIRAFFGVFFDLKRYWKICAQEMRRWLTAHVCFWTFDKWALDVFGRRNNVNIFDRIDWRQVVKYRFSRGRTLEIFGARASAEFAPGVN